jgi:hypothetical protein
VLVRLHQHVLDDVLGMLRTAQQTAGHPDESGAAGCHEGVEVAREVARAAASAAATVTLARPRMLPAR